MDRQIIGSVICYIGVFAFPALIVLERSRYLCQTRGWLEVTGEIVRAREVVLGEAVLPFVDVRYKFQKARLVASDLAADSLGNRRYPPGGSILLLVNPNEPNEVMVRRRSSFLDNWLRRRAERPANRSPRT